LSTATLNDRNQNIPRQLGFGSEPPVSLGIENVSKMLHVVVDLSATKIKQTEDRRPRS
jgi:uncharacterized metal-binding protein